MPTTTHPMPPTHRPATHPSRRGLRWVAPLSAVALLGSGCSQTSTTPAAPSSTVVIVAGSHANAPAPVLAGATHDLVAAAVAQNTFAGVVGDDGTPDLRPVSLVAVRGSEAARKVAVAANLSRIQQAMGAGPDSRGADPWEAVSRAADAVRGTTRPVIVFADSGLGDQGVINTATPGVLGAAPADVVAARRGALGVDLTGITVRLTGLGYTAGAQQQPLDAAQRRQLISLWTAMLKAAGATVQIDTTPVGGDAVATTLTVTPTPVTKLAPVHLPTGCGSATSTFDDSTVQFVADQATFLHPKTAAASVRQVAVWLAADPRRRANITGTAADDGGSKTGQRRLSLQRAQAVADLLISQGAQPGQITTIEGLGSEFPGYVPDKRPDGTLDPDLARANRKVTITTTAAGTC